MEEVQDTYSFRHCDLVQLQGFRGLEVVSDGDKLKKTQNIPHEHSFFIFIMSRLREDLMQGVFCSS